MAKRKTIDAHPHSGWLLFHLLTQLELAKSQ